MVLKVVLAFVILLVAVILIIWFERKLIAGMQNRRARCGPGRGALLITLADGLKLILKEDLIPRTRPRFVFKLAPFLSVVPAFLTFCIVPAGGELQQRQRRRGRRSSARRPCCRWPIRRSASCSCWP